MLWKWSEHNKGSHFRHNCRSVAFLSDSVKQTDANVAIRAPGVLVTISNDFTLKIKLLENIQIIFSAYFPTNVLCNITHLTHSNPPTCFGTQVPSSGSNYKRGVRANLLIYLMYVCPCIINENDERFNLMQTIYLLL